jgi:hypothetical protein
MELEDLARRNGGNVDLIDLGHTQKLNGSERVSHIAALISRSMEGAQLVHKKHRGPHNLRLASS